jgi:hypothetical protein
MKGKKPHRPYVIALTVFLIAVLAILFLPRLLYGALLESRIERSSETELKEYAEQVGKRLNEDPTGDSWRDVRGARVLAERRPDRSTLIISTAVTVTAVGIFFGSELVVRCYDISFMEIGTPDQQFDLDKVPGCDQELRGPAIPGSS